MSAFLTPEELQRLTGRTRPSAQRRALDALGIRYVRTATGEPLVRPEWLDAAGRPTTRSVHRWDMIGHRAPVAPLARPRR